MSYVSWILRFLIFIVLLGFAFKNAEITTIHYWFGYEWRAPLVLMLIGFLLAGIVVGLLAALGTIFRQRRQIQSLKKELKLHGTQVTPAPSLPPATPAVTDRPVV